MTFRFVLACAATLSLSACAAIPIPVPFSIPGLSAPEAPLLPETQGSWAVTDAGLAFTASTGQVVVSLTCQTAPRSLDVFVANAVPEGGRAEVVVRADNGGAFAAGLIPSDTAGSIGRISVSGVYQEPFATARQITVGASGGDPAAYTLPVVPEVAGLLTSCP